MIGNLLNPVLEKVDWDLLYLQHLVFVTCVCKEREQLEGLADLIGDLLAEAAEAGIWKTQMCSVCDARVPASTAHLHQGNWIGDACCWDDRLKASE